MLHFTLVGKVKELGNVPREHTNSDVLECIRQRVEEHFGSRPTLIIEKEALENETTQYPDCYIAGWFISETPINESDIGSELVLIEHGSSMKAARQALMASIKTVDWDATAKDILV
jgi:hypothetical protein